MNICDLTQMFGSTIADYIYTLETSHTGDGVAWFRKLFPKPYYAYNAGELMSVQAASHKMTGFNQWDEEWELGGYSTSNGQKAADNTRIRNKNYIPCLPNTTYCNSSPATMIVLYYDAGKNFISYEGVLTNITFTTPSNCGYINFYMATAYGTTYNNDICINLHWDGERDGEYEPYTVHSYALDSDLVLRGIPKLDADNKLYYDGDTYESDGTVTRRYGVVDIGTLNWTYYSEYQMFYVTVTGKVKGLSNLICSNYRTAEDTEHG